MSERTFDDLIAESFRNDPSYAAELLNDILEDGEPGELLIMLRQMSKAFGGMDEIAKQAQLNGKSLYRTLSAEGNPQVSTLVAVLRAMGMRLAVQPLQPLQKAA